MSTSAQLFHLNKSLILAKKIINIAVLGQGCQSMMPSVSREKYDGRSSTSGGFTMIDQGNKL